MKTSDITTLSRLLENGEDKQLHVQTPEGTTPVTTIHVEGDNLVLHYTEIEALFHEPQSGNTQEVDRLQLKLEDAEIRLNTQTQLHKDEIKSKDDEISKLNKEKEELQTSMNRVKESLKDVQQQLAEIGDKQIDFNGLSYDQLQAENNRLQAENHQLQAENGQLKEVIEQWKQTYKELSDSRNKAIEERDDLRAVNAGLLAQQEEAEHNADTCKEHYQDKYNNLRNDIINFILTEGSKYRTDLILTEAIKQAFQFDNE